LIRITFNEFVTHPPFSDYEKKTLLYYYYITLLSINIFSNYCDCIIIFSILNSLDMRVVIKSTKRGFALIFILFSTKFIGIIMLIVYYSAYLTGQGEEVNPFYFSSCLYSSPSSTVYNLIFIQFA